MAIAERTKQYLDNKHIIYDVRALPAFASVARAAELAGISAAAAVKAEIVKDEIGALLVVLPATHELDIDALSKLLHRRMETAGEAQIKQLFSDCLPAFVPPFGEAYGVRVVVDDSLVAREELYFAAGDDGHLLRVSNKDFFNLLSAASLAGNFSRAGQGGGGQDGLSAPVTDLKKRIESLKTLPGMPELAQRIIALRADPAADAERLTRLVELDPSLAAQVVRYARSPFFGYRGKIDSVQAAISRVLGLEMVMNLALGIATARPFKMPALGPLGLNAFWRHAVYTAAVVQALAREMPRHLRPPAGVSYLAGLLHNFGHLLLGHLFKREFCLLNNAVSDDPSRSVVEQELALLGVEHGEVGAWLMTSWNMPAEIIVAMREHHHEGYDGPHATYARLVLLADRLLKEHGIGDAPSHELPPAILAALGIEEIQAVMVMGRILEGCEDLNAVARNLAAA